MAQQTGVKWLIEQMQRGEIQSKHNGKFKWTISQNCGNDILGTALAMEKEQRIKDYNAGYDDAQCNHINDAENYANEQEYLHESNIGI